MQRFTAPRGEIVFDDSHWPVLFITWRGVADVAAVDGYFDLQERATARAKAEGTKLAILSDAIDAGRPDATVRRRIAERSDAMDFQSAHACSFIVIENTLVRGALTAIQWIARSNLDVEYVSSCSEAIERALACLDGMGIRRPGGLTPEGYRRPLSARAS